MDHLWGGEQRQNQRDQISALDSLFLKNLHNLGFFQTLPQIHGVNNRSQSETIASAYSSGKESHIHISNNPNSISLDGLENNEALKDSFVSDTWVRWVVLAHEATHCELNQKTRAFHNEKLSEQANTWINQNLLLATKDNAFRTLFHEMMADAYSTMVVLQASNFDKEAINQIQLYGTIREGVENKIDEKAIEASQSGKKMTALDVLKHNPHQTSKVMFAVLNSQKEWQNKDPKALFNYAQKVVSEMWLDKVFNQKLDLSNTYPQRNSLWENTKEFIQNNIIENPISEITNLAQSWFLSAIKSGNIDLPLQATLGDHFQTPSGAWLVENKDSFSDFLKEWTEKNPELWADFQQSQKSSSHPLNQSLEDFNSSRILCDDWLEDLFQKFNQTGNIPSFKSSLSIKLDLKPSYALYPKLEGEAGLNPL